MRQCISVTDIDHLLGQFCRLYEKIDELVHINTRVLLCILNDFPWAFSKSIAC